MLFLDIIKENKNEIDIYKVRYINYKDVKYTKDIKELSINPIEEPYSQINFKEFVFDIAGEDICVWNMEKAILLKGLTNCVADKINIKNIFNGEKIYMELDEMLDKYKEPGFNIDSYREMFNTIKLEEDSVIKMLNMYELALTDSIIEDYKIFKLKKEILLRLECIKSREKDSLESFVYMSNYLHREIENLTEKHILTDFKINDYCIPYRWLFETEEDDIEIPF